MAQKSADGMSSRLTLTYTCSRSVLLLLLGALMVQASGLQCSNSNHSQNSYLWRIETSPPIYLYGTMHVPYKKMWNDMPENVKGAFSQSEHLCVELRLTDSDTLRNLSSCRFLSKNTELKDVMPRDLYERVVRYLIQVRSHFPRWLYGNKTLNVLSKLTSDQLFESMIGSWKRLRPIWLLMLLSSLSRENIQDRNIPLLDTFMDRAAEGMGKNVEALEIYKEQCRPFNKLNRTKVLTALRKQLDYLEPLIYSGDGPVSTTESNLNTYHCGDFLNLVQSTSILPLPSLSNLPNLTDSEASDLTDINEYLKSKIILRRNRRITNKLESLLRGPRNETYMFAVGAGHFLGTKSIVHMLQKRQYRVTRVAADEDINGPPLPDNIISLGDPSSQLRVLKVSTDTSTTPTKATPNSLPTLSPETVSKIVKSIQNKTSSLYRIDSVEVTPTLSATPSPSSSPQQFTSSSTRSIAMETDVSADNDIVSGSSRWLINFNILLTSLIITVLTVVLHL